MKTTYSFEEEKQPCGDHHFGLVNPYYGGEKRTPPTGTTVAQVKTHPWWLVVWEPLTTKVPNPNLAKPYCCYARSVVFHVRGYILRPFIHLYRFRDEKWSYSKPGSMYEEWDHVEHTFMHEDVIEYQGQKFDISCGRVVWYGKQWWMRYCARRLKQ